MENLYNKEIADEEVKLVRCRECRHKDTEFCRAMRKTKYDLKKSKWKCRTMMEEDGFCHIGERK